MRSSSGPHLPVACWGEHLHRRHQRGWTESKCFSTACKLERRSSGRQIRGAPKSLRARRLPAPRSDGCGSMKRRLVLALACFLVFVVAAENRLGSLVTASPALQLSPDGTATSGVVEPQPKSKRLLGNERTDREPGPREKRPTLVSPATSRSKQQQRQPSKANLPRHMQETTRPLRTYTFGNIHQTAYYFAGELATFKTRSNPVGRTSCVPCPTHILPSSAGTEDVPLTNSRPQSCFRSQQPSAGDGHYVSSTE